MSEAAIKQILTSNPFAHWWHEPAKWPEGTYPASVQSARQETAITARSAPELAPQLQCPAPVRQLLD